MDHIEALFRAHYRGLVQLAEMLLHDGEMARDVVHDLFAGLMDSGADGVGAGYLYASVRNRCLNHLRDCDRRERIRNLYSMECDAVEDEEWPDAETLGRIYGIINEKLPERTRLAVELRFGSGMQIAEVAQAMGIGESAVYRHLHDALVMIRKRVFNISY